MRPSTKPTAQTNQSRQYQRRVDYRRDSDAEHNYTVDPLMAKILGDVVVNR
jgi:hypothetical protein